MESSTRILDMQKKHRRLNMMVNWGYSVILLIFILGVVYTVHWYGGSTRSIPSTNAEIKSEPTGEKL